jgi:hypothetical protein
MTSDVSVRTDYVRRANSRDPASPWIVIGVYDVHYLANTVYDIDANLECLSGDHPDVDRLLDARRLVSAANAIFPAPCSLVQGGECPPSIFAGCICSHAIQREHGHGSRNL